MAEQNMAFEESISRLEEITKLLDSGSVSLDEMLGLFEEGIKLTKGCMEKLDKAEQKVNILMKNANGEVNSQPFGEMR